MTRLGVARNAQAATVAGLAGLAIWFISTDFKPVSPPVKTGRLAARALAAETLKGRGIELTKSWETLTDLKTGGIVWLMTPKVGREGYVDASDIAEATETAGLSTTSSLTPTENWSATKLVMPKSPRVRK